MTQKQKTILEIAGTIIFLAIISIILQFSSPNIADPDGFYHIRHAYIYRTQGIFDSSFPWTQYSVIRIIGADIWYGFHIFLIPFTYFKDLVFGIKVGGAVITFLTLFIFWWALKRLGVIWPWLWPILLVVSGPDLMYRFTMTRPHNLSFALGLLIFSFLIKGRRRDIFMASAVLAFIHIALAWLPLLVGLVTVAIKYIKKHPIEWTKITALMGGILIGLLARPHPSGGLKLAYIQVVDILIAKLNHIPLLFGRELKGLSAEAFFRQILPILILSIIVILFFKYSSKRAVINQTLTTAFNSAVFLAAIFLTISLVVAQRGYDSLSGYLIMAVAIIATGYFHANKSENLKRKVLAGAIIIIGLMSINSISLFKKYMVQAWSPHYLKEVSLWLKENTKPGEIVFNTRWDYFGGLFFWNTQNYYIGAMDPIFEYAYNEPLYWKSYFIAADVGHISTCGKIRCVKEEIENTHTVLVNDFKASYLMLRQIQNPKLYFYLVKENKFPLVFDNSREAVFKIPPLQ